MDIGQSVRTAKSWTQADICKLIQEIILDVAPTRGEAAAGARLVEELGFNSLALLELAFSLEDEFDLPTIDEATARRILTVGDVDEHVLKHLRSTGQVTEG
jgi:acyl carrier protein